ncbi:MAG: alpha/beta hydrolase [Ginsengibacter sp.]
MKRVDFKDKRICYRVEGEGKPVMLLHGFAENGDLWKYQVENLKDNFKFIIPDLPGSGSSEALNGNPSMVDYADAIKAIIDLEIKESSFALIGHSMGGYIALAFAEKYPELLNSVGLFHSTSYADDDQKKETRNNGIDFIKRNGPELFLKNTIPNLFSENNRKENLTLSERSMKLSKNISQLTLIQYYEAMRDRPNYSPVLKNFKKPVLLIQGLHDNAVHLKSGLEQSYVAPVTYFNILKNSGHMGMWEEEKISTALLGKFLMEL